MIPAHTETKDKTQRELRPGKGEGASRGCADGPKLFLSMLRRDTRAGVSAIGVRVATGCARRRPATPDLKLRLLALAVVAEAEEATEGNFLRISTEAGAAAAMPAGDLISDGRLTMCWANRGFRRDVGVASRNTSRPPFFTARTAS